jgi:hypothetical protein
VELTHETAEGVAVGSASIGAIMSVQIREQQLPGMGRRYELDLENDRQLVVIAERGGGRRLH